MMSIFNVFSRFPHYVKPLIIVTIINLLLLSIRNYLVGDSIFNFLKSNLWSGVVPFLLAFGLLYFYKKIPTWVFWCVIGVWVLFYPNSPYMISDLIHDNMDTKPIENLIVYDTLLIFSIAMLSVFYGFLSLKLMFYILDTKYSKKVAHTIISITIILSCLGFYMGREIKSGIPFGNGYLYSSQIFTHPIEVLKVVWKCVWPIGDHIPAYIMMALFGIVQWCLLAMFKDIGDVEDDKEFNIKNT